ncbi:MAG: hypothetical protein AB7O43_20345 [Hyphomicrobiaceae bacterium]
MQLSEMRFVKIDGSHVSVKVNSAEEAKIAVKELRHKKKEYTHLKRTLVKARKQLASDMARPKGRRPKKQSTMDQVRGFLETLTSVAGVLKRANAEQDLQLVDREMKKVDAILHNLDTVRLQIEGRLLNEA